MPERQKVMTPVFRAAFANVFKPQSFNGGEPKYGVTMVFPKDADLKAMRQLAQKAAKDKWGDKIPKGLRNPFRDGAEKEHLDGFDGTVVFAAATSKYQPGVVDKDVQPIIDESEVYSGCFMRATVTAYDYDISGNKGVAFGLQNLQKIKDGPAFGGRTDATEDFDAVDSPDEGEGEAAPKGGAGDPLFDE